MATEETEAKVAIAGQMPEGAEPVCESPLSGSKAGVLSQSVILDTMADAVIALDPNRVVTYFNRAAERLYGVKSSEALGQQLSATHGYEWLTPDDEKQCWTDLAQRGMWTGEYIHIRRDGSRIIASSTVSVIPEEFGGGMMAVIRDVSEKKQAELEMRRQAQELARANEELEHFANVVSHDLKAPLRTMVSFSQLLAMRNGAKLDENGAEYIRLIVEAGSRMSAMIQDLLELAQVGDKREDQLTPLKDALAAALDNLRSEIHATEARITHGPLPELTVELRQMAQVFQNLIGNSLKYQKPGKTPEVQISAKRAKNEWVISVQDNGIGFETQYADQIFGVFKRLHGNEYAGTGIGLAICKRIVERRGGRIQAAAKPGEGAVFSFSIPDAVAERDHPERRENRTTVMKPAPQPAELTLTYAAPFDELFHTLDLAHAMVRDMEGKVLVWSRGTERFYGWTKEEAAGQHLHSMLKTVFPVPLLEIEAELYVKGEWKGQLKKYKKDGSSCWLATHWALYRDGSGRGRSVIEVDNDITALRQAEEALKHSSEQRDLALHAGQMGVWRCFRRTGRVEWDATVERMHGMAPGSFEGTWEAFEKTAHPDDLPIVRAQVAEAFEDQAAFQTEFRALRANGEFFWVRGQGQVTCENGEATGIEGVVWDVSLRKQAELDREFLLDLSAKLTQNSKEAVLIETTLTDLCKYLAANRCTYTEINLETQQAVAFADYQPNAHSIKGTYSLDLFGPLVEDLKAGQPVTVSDTETDSRKGVKETHAYRSFGTRSMLAVPLHREGVWRAALSATDKQPRVWQEREIAMLRGVAERLWPAVENARLLRLIQDSR